MPRITIPRLALAVAAVIVVAPALVLAATRLAPHAPYPRALIARPFSLPSVMATAATPRAATPTRMPARATAPATVTATTPARRPGGAPETPPMPVILVPPEGPPAPPQAPDAPPAPLLPPDAPPSPAGPLDPLGSGPIVAGPLNGLPTPRGLAGRRPLAVMVENYYPDARPQTGLLEASVVFETVAEWGITRFMAVYAEQDAAVVGPVRSARVYYDHWADGLHAIYVHAGGNSDAVAELWGLKDLVNVDELFTERGLADTGADYFARSAARLAPHNLYTYPARVRAHVEAMHQRVSSALPFYVLLHKAEARMAGRPGQGSIDMAFSTAPFAVHYDYERQTNSYLRSMGGAPHADAVSGERIAPKNVAVLVAGVRPDLASDTLGSIVVQSEGEGPAYYFMDGTVRRGTWRKAGTGAPLELLDGAGQAVRFNAGQTWIEVVPRGNSLSWSAPTAP
ncbi:MAG: hypothetical protein NVSMB65_13590 [Chloroflexota bacterium]